MISEALTPSSPRPSADVRIDALGQSDAFIDFQERLARVAPVERPVLLVGERGTGKELAATRLHFLSRRWAAPLVSLNCAALNTALIEAELFGYEKGAFTGAAGRRVGRFEAADGGTLFLDEVGLIPMEVQEKILRVVEYGTFERVGSSVPVEVDVRIIGATNTDLLRLTEDGQFKRDLLDRLSFEVLFVPPLRARHGDVMLLAAHFARRMAYELGRQAMPEFATAAAAALEGYAWPGNVRELKNVVERAVYRSPETVIHRVDFEPFRSPFDAPAPPAPSPVAVEKPEAKAAFPVDFKEAVRNLERSLLKEALSQARHNQKAAAALLGLSYDQFRGLRKKHAAAL